jgi:RNA polymerase sigma factor (sigma-70 family)
MRNKKINKTAVDINKMDKNEVVTQYEPLVNKLTKQFTDKINVPWEDVKSMAYEGLAIAIKTYDSNRSNMTFTQFAGFAIRNNILTSLNNELRTVKLSAYAQKKAVEHGNAVFNTVSIDYANSDNQSDYGGGFTSAPKRNEWTKLSTSDKWSDGDVFETMYTKLEDNFAVRDCEIFYMTFGLKGHDEIKGKDIADYFGISRSLVSVKLKNVISFIQKDEELIEILSNLLK